MIRKILLTLTITAALQAVAEEKGAITEDILN